MFTSDNDIVIENGAVLIDEDGIIKAVGKAEKLSTCGSTKVIDYGDATIMPGLTDMHVHAGYWQTKSDAGIYAESPGLMALLAVDELKGCFAQGVTTVRTVGDPPEGLGYTIKMALKKGFFKGPRYISCNKGITSIGGHAYIINVEADSVDSFRKAVRKQIKDGADWIKLMASDRIPYSHITQEEMTAATEEAHNWGKKVCIHATTERSIEFAINAGVDSIEHGSCMTVEQAKRACDKGIAWVPTIIAHESYYERMNLLNSKPAEERSLIDQIVLEDGYDQFTGYYNSMKENFAALAATGIKIAAGTDMVNELMPLTPVREEKLLLNKYGLSLFEALKAATSNAADILGLENITGRVKEGLCADLLVVDGDLTENLANIKDIRAVYREGALVYTKAR